MERISVPLFFLSPSIPYSVQIPVNGVKETLYFSTWRQSSLGPRILNTRARVLRAHISSVEEKLKDVKTNYQSWCYLWQI